MPTYQTFTDLVISRAEEFAGTEAHVFLRESDGGMVPERLTYAELDREARRIASRLQEYGVHGQPVLLLYPPGADFLKAFIGCLYAGAVAVPAPLPGLQGQSLKRVSGIMRDTGARLVLSDTANAPEVSLWLATAGRAGAVCLATNTSAWGDPDAWRAPRSGPDDLAFLQYTSGSTSQPRGVVVSHANLMANQAAIGRLLQTTPEDRFGGWLPHYHDMGLIAHLLHPIWLGSSAVQMSPISFLKQPVRWLRAIDEHGVTVGGGPNFSYDLCLRRVQPAQSAGIDLSRWRLALNGAEPVRADTLEAFARRFAPNGLRLEAISPGYGLAEATLVVSSAVPGAPYAERAVDVAGLERGELSDREPGRPARTLVGSGRVLDFDVRIVDPVRGCELPEGAIGEIWLKGESVAQGYWRRPEETARTFHATLQQADQTTLPGFLRTGDLGVLTGGELFVTGRLKETIILNGRNLFPQDIEWAVRDLHPAFSAGPGCAFTVESERERLVIIQEFRSRDGDVDTHRALARDIQELIGKEFNVPAGNVLLVRPGTIRRTTSGKIQRGLMRKLFLAGELKSVYEVLDPEIRTLVSPNGIPLVDDLLDFDLPGATARGQAPSGWGEKQLW